MPKKIKLTNKGADFLKQIEKLSGETITMCDQCGTCSGGCPFVEEMDIMPSQIMRMTMLGQMEVLDSKTMWICASCFTCTVRCPRLLDVSKVSEALRQTKLRQAIDNIDIEAISKEEAEELPSIAVVSAFRKFTS